MPYGPWSLWSGRDPVSAAAKFAYAFELYQIMICAFGDVPASRDVILEESRRCDVSPLELLARKRSLGQP